MNKLIVFGAAGVALAGAGAAVLLFGGGPASAAKGGYEYETKAVDRGAVQRIVSASGQVRALTQTEVGSQVSGRIVELNVDYNSTVRAGDVLARIDPLTFDTQVRSAEANLRSAEASIAIQRASLEKAKATFANSQKSYTRQSNLFQEQAISTAAMENSERDFTFAKADVELAEAQLRSSLASLEQRKASLESAKVDLSRTYIRSPIDGVVIDRSIEIGQTVQASFSAPKLFVIAQDLGDIRIDAEVVESDIGGLTEGDPVVFTVDAFAGERFRGVVEQVRKAGVERANVVTYTVVVKARNPDQKLLPGMTANVEITAESREDALRIAADALRFSPPKEVQEAMAAEAGPAAAGGAGGGGAAGGAAGGARAFGGAGGGGGRGGPPFGEWLAEIGVDKPRIETISAELRKEMQGVFPQQRGAQSFGPPPDMQAIRQRMQAAQDAVLKRHLSQEELAKFNEKRAEMQSQKRAPAFVLSAEGKLQRRMLVIGVNDGDQVEILGGAEEGDQFVVRSKPTARK